jgi:hypothetical protein
MLLVCFSNMPDLFGQFNFVSSEVEAAKHFGYIEKTTYRRKNLQYRAFEHIKFDSTGKILSGWVLHQKRHSTYSKHRRRRRIEQIRTDYQFGYDSSNRLISVYVHEYVLSDSALISKTHLNYDYSPTSPDSVRIIEIDTSQTQMGLKCDIDTCILDLSEKKWNYSSNANCRYKEPYTYDAIGSYLYRYMPLEHKIDTLGYWTEGSQKCPSIRRSYLKGKFEIQETEDWGNDTICMPWYFMQYYYFEGRIHKVVDCTMGDGFWSFDEIKKIVRKFRRSQRLDFRDVYTFKYNEKGQLVKIHSTNKFIKNEKSEFRYID